MWVFGRRADYDTNQEAIVRVSAAEIRKRIAQYYHEPGHGPSCGLNYRWVRAITERFGRVNFRRLEIEVTVDDPKVYTKPWTVEDKPDAPARYRLDRFYLRGKRTDNTWMPPSTRL